MIEALTNNRLVMAVRLAFYPTFESAEAKRFQVVTRQAQDARNAGDLAGAEQFYLSAMAHAEASTDQSYLNLIRYSLAQVYQEQQRYREAELILSNELEEAIRSPKSSTQVHAAHMHLARLYQAEGELAKAEEHYKRALAQTEKASSKPASRTETPESQTETPELSTARELYFSTALQLARFYVEQHRYSDAEPLFKRALEIREATRPSDSSLPHYLQDFAKVYEAQEKYAAAEELYRRSLSICEELATPADFGIVRALDELARFCQGRGRYSEAEDLSCRSLALVEEKMTSQIKKYSRQRSNDCDAQIKHARVPISAALDRLADLYEAQEKYSDSEPLRKRSLEIKQQAYSERISWIWVDALAAYANALHKLGRDHEAKQLDDQVATIRAKYPPGSVRTSVRLTSTPMKRTLRGRFIMFMNALRQPNQKHR